MTGQTNLLENELIIDNIAATQLKETLKWAKFLSIAGFIVSGLIAIITLLAGAGIFFSKFEGRGRTDMLALRVGMSIYIAIAVVAFFMSIFLFQFAKKTQIALRSSDQESLVAAFKNLKIYFRFAGIITIVSLIFSVLGVVGILITTSLSRY